MVLPVATRIRHIWSAIELRHRRSLQRHETSRDAGASKQGFSDSMLDDLQQAQVAGGQVRKGEHGTTAIFYTTLEKENDAGEVEHIPMLKTFTVFNVQQIDGLSLTTETVSPEATFDPVAAG